MNYFDYWLFREIEKPNNKDINTRSFSKIEVKERPLTEAEIEELLLHDHRRNGSSTQ